MAYEVIIPSPVVKLIKLINDDDKAKILSKLQMLELNPKPYNSLKLKGYDQEYRLRVGDYRIRYLINKSMSEVVILDIAHRKDIYKKR